MYIKGIKAIIKAKRKINIIENIGRNAATLYNIVLPFNLKINIVNIQTNKKIIIGG